MLNNIILRLFLYYAVWLLALSGIYELFPQILYYVAQERQRIFVAQSVGSAATPNPMALGNIEEGVARLADPVHTVPIIVALVLSFGITLPITWVYRWTRSRKKYSQSFAHTLLVVPVAIALVVFLVKGSLALAFSLAGIVAAVRFRTSLEESMDAVYMLIAIGIGLAAGTQLVSVAYIASLAFVAIALGVFKSNFGAQPAVLSGWSLVPTDKEAPETKKPYNAQVEVHTTDADAAQKATASILKSKVKRWQVATVINAVAGTAVVVFDVWLKKSVDPPTLERDIKASGAGFIDKVIVKNRDPQEAPDEPARA